MKLTICLLQFTALFLLTYGMGTFPSSQITPATTSSFTQYVYFNAGEKPTSCSLKYIDDKNKTIEIPISLHGPQHFGSDDFQKRLSNLGRGICGVKLDNCTESDSRLYNMTVHHTPSENKQTMTEISFYVQVSASPVTIKDTVKTVKLGSPAKISCHVGSSVQCALFNPQGVLVDITTSCKHEIPRITSADIGRWRCVPTVLRTMQHKEAYVELQLQKETEMVAWYKQEDNYGIIHCEYHPAVSIPITYCQFISPENKMYTIKEVNQATERYTSLGTNMTALTCQIEFPLPILESELGNWLCLVRTFAGSIGYYINTNPTKSINYPKKTELYVLPNSFFTVLCRVPYSSDHCYIRSPTGLIYSGGDYTNVWRGICSARISSKDLEFGTWRCHYSKKDSAVDDVITVEVISYDNITSVVEEIEVDESDEAELLCNVASPINYCRFEGPNNATFHVSPDKRSGDFTYYGDGFDKGQCGMKISKVQKNEEGTWNCITNSTSNVEIRGETKLRVNTGMSAATAAAIGAPAGVIGLALLFGAWKLYKKYKKSKSKTNRPSASAPRRESDTSNESNIEMPIVQGIPSNTATYGDTPV